MAVMLGLKGNVINCINDLAQLEMSDLLIIHDIQSDNPCLDKHSVTISIYRQCSCQVSVCAHSFMVTDTDD